MGNAFSFRKQCLEVDTLLRKNIKIEEEKHLSNEEDDDNDDSSECSFSLLDNLTVIEDVSLKMELNLSEASSDDETESNIYSIKNEHITTSMQQSHDQYAPSGSSMTTLPAKNIKFETPVEENVIASTSPVKKTQFADELIQKDELIKHEPANITKLPKAILKKVNVQSTESTNNETQSSNEYVKKKQCKVEKQSVKIDKIPAVQEPQPSWAVKATKSNIPNINEQYTTEISPDNINLTISKKRKNCKIKCPMCDKECKSKKNYKVHLTLHDPNHPHKCDICGKPSLNAIALANHRAIHTGKNLFICTYF